MADYTINPSSMGQNQEVVLALAVCAGDSEAGVHLDIKPSGPVWLTPDEANALAVRLLTLAMVPEVDRLLVPDALRDQLARDAA